MNRTPWVLQRRIPMHWLTGIIIHLGSKGWLCRTGLFGPAAMYIWVLHCSSRQQPPRQPGPDPSHDFGCTGAPPAACHALSNMEISALSGQAALNEFNFAQVIVLPEKNFPATPAWPPSPLCSHRATKVLWSKHSNREKKGRGRRAQQARATAETRDGFKAAEPSSASSAKEETKL